jgi:hypothetical protein
MDLCFWSWNALNNHAPNMTETRSSVRAVSRRANERDSDGIKKALVRIQGDAKL